MPGPFGIVGAGVEYFASATVNNILYVMGGAVSGNTTTNVNQAFDPVTNTWSIKAPVPDARGEGTGGSSSAGAASIGGLIYYAGGFNLYRSFGVLGALRVYNPVTDTWAERAPMITPRWGLAAAQVKGLFYAIGGTTTSGFNGVITNVVEAYNPALDAWKAVAPMPTARIYPAAVELNGLLYVIGGVLPKGHPTNVVEVYDPATNTWTTGAPMPTARGGLAVGVIGSTIYAVGGGTAVYPPQRLQVGLGPLPGYANEAYDAASNTWTTRLPLPRSRQGLGGGVISSVLYVAGGDVGGRADTAGWAYTP